MALSINSNTLAMQIARNLNDNATQLQKISSQIASGKRIQTAADDPAASGILSSLKMQASSYSSVLKNITSGTSVLEVSDAALQSQQAILQQMKDLATQGASSTLTAGQRAALQSSFVELQGQLTSVAENAKIFGVNLIGSSATAVTLQTGINAGDTRTLSTAKSDAVTLAVDAASIDLSDAASASSAMTALDLASETVGTNQSIIGTQMTGLNATSENVKTTQGALAKSMSKIEDADIPELSSQLALLQSKQQLSSSMLGLVNSFPQYLLSLLN